MTFNNTFETKHWQEEFGPLDERSARIEKKYMIAYSDINVFLGDNVRSNTQSAFRKAVQLLDEPELGKVLVINTSSRQRWALAVARTVDASRIGDEVAKPVCVMGTVAGELCNEFEAITETIVRHDIRVLMINSWEFASATPRYKDKLLFQLRKLVEEHSVTVIIYSQQMNVGRLDTGRLTRGGLGKLSSVAATICSIESDHTLRQPTIQKKETMVAIPEHNVIPKHEIAVEPRRESRPSEQYVAPSRMYDNVLDSVFDRVEEEELETSYV